MNEQGVQETVPRIQARNDEVPNGWVVAKLSEIASINMGQSPPGETYNETGKGLPFFQGKADFGGRYPTVRVWCSSPKKVAQAGDVLLSVRAPVGPTNIADKECTIGRGLAALTPLGGIPTEFLLHAFRQREDELSLSGTGSTFAAINKNDIREMGFWLPPLAEQKRIVGQVEALLARVNVARERLSKVPDILKRFRQSVLAAAYSGQLTADWRDEHPHTESAYELLERIRKGVLTQLKKKREIDVYNAMFEECLSEYSNEELPESWLSCRVGHIGFICNGSTPSRKCPEFWGGEINWVSSGEVQNNLIHSTRERITEAGFSNSSVRLLPPGTVLIAMIGEGKTRGQTAILEIESTINQNMAAIDLRHGGVLSKYLWYWFKFRYLLTRQEGAGSGPPALNCQRVRELPFILPPFSEQQEIVRRIESLFVLADRIEQRTKSATERVKKTTQSILARAFHGELVETEAQLARREGREFESAAQLLDRIQAEREKSAST